MLRTEDGLVGVPVPNLPADLRLRVGASVLEAAAQALRPARRVPADAPVAGSDVERARTEPVRRQSDTGSGD